jgi:ppGpp synthetase/RelA/SpoT-type nucleotidyltranferase
MTTSSELQNEVTSYLGRWRPMYEAFLENILLETVKFRERAENFDRLYRIYTRSDKQRGGGKLKSIPRIAEKLERWRAEKPTCGIKEIHDIVGLTVVTYYSSDIEDISKRFQAWKNPVFKVAKFEDKSARGYFARHFHLRSLNPTHDGILAELQLKSLLHDGWAAKVHDLTYNPSVRVGPPVQTMIETLGSTLENIERMSGELRDLTNKHIEADRSRRDMAVTTLMFEFTQDQKREHDSEIAALANKLLKAKEKILDCDANSPQLVAFTSRWKKIVAKMGYCRETCRFIILLASIRHDNDFDELALDAVEQWVRGSTDIKQKARATSFLALSNYILGYIDAAIENGRNDVKLKVQAKSPAALARINLAYYLAEKIFVSPPKAKNAQILKEIKMLLKELPRRAENVQLSASFKDSEGAIKIMTAKRPEEVYAGLQLCDKARKLVAKTKGAKVFNVYYELHARRAQAKLSELQDA